VVAIWSFESLNDYFKRVNIGRRYGVSSLGAPAPSMSFKTSFFKASRNYPQTLAFNQATLVGARRASKSATNTPHRHVIEVSTEAREDLESLVIKLCSQVDQLSALVAGQQMERKSPD
jgi:hypothetical protein